MIKVLLAAAIRDTLTENDIKQSTLAGAAGMSENTVSLICNGFVGKVRVDTLLRVCEVLGIEITLNIKKPA